MTRSREQLLEEHLRMAELYGAKIMQMFPDRCECGILSETPCLIEKAEFSRYCFKHTEHTKRTDEQTSIRT